MIFEENLRYKHDCYPKENLPSEWKTILKWVGENKNVLEVGCHTGDFSEQMRDAGCSVTGIEINSKALEVAKPFLIEAICGDIESKQTWQPLEEKKFDAILYEHVLEHLSDPWQILTDSKKYLSKDGIVIIALPNISNARSRFDMFFGKFDYADIGVMDRTHLRFFNQKTARELITQAGMNAEVYEAHWRVNPVREFIDHLPLLNRLRFMFKENRSGSSLFSNNLTDVVMLFKCTQINT